jgi:hypothetical protein
MAIVAVVSLVSVIVASHLVDMHIGTARLAMATLYTALFSLSFGAITFALNAASVVTRRASTALAVALAFGGYLVTSLSTLTDWLGKPAKLMPYHYFAPDQILNGHDVPTGLLVYLLGTAAVCTLGAWLGFRGRDLE